MARLCAHWALQAGRKTGLHTPSCSSAGFCGAPATWWRDPVAHCRLKARSTSFPVFLEVAGAAGNRWIFLAS